MKIEIEQIFTKVIFTGHTTIIIQFKIYRNQLNRLFTKLIFTKQIKNITNLCINTFIIKMYFENKYKQKLNLNPVLSDNNSNQRL